MRTTQYLLATLKEVPADAEIVSHQLMLRAGLIRKLAAGLYIWLPTGLRVLKKIEAVVRQEMDKVGAIELSMPITQPASIWQESGRLEQYGAELLRFSDRNDRNFVLGPTHEEVITYLLRNEISSYKHLPLNLYQIQTKFRDEIRPRFGIIRTREFIMKDGYSFHLDKSSLEQTYSLMYEAYCRIFRHLDLDFRAVQADSGSIGGNCSHEFQVLTDSGEDEIVFSTASDYAANIELAEAVVPFDSHSEPTKPLQLIDTLNVKHVNEQIIQQPISKTIKVLVVRGASIDKYPLVALIIRGDHNLNKVKAEKLLQVASPLELVSEEEIRAAIGVGSASIGPINLSLPMIIDRSVAIMKNFSAGANIDNTHYINVNWQRDLPMPDVADIRNVVEGDISPDGRGVLRIKRGIEVGHIFQLGNKYSTAMKAVVQGEDGQNHTVEMGCYGIGISRIVAAAIEQHHDEAGITWPASMAPFQVIIIPINLYKSTEVLEVSEYLYTELLAAGIEVLFDDRKERPGIMFADAELIGIPHMVVISERNLSNHQVEYKSRKKEIHTMINNDEIIQYLIDKCKQE